MRVADEAALICDFAEYYHVLDVDALPVRLAATLACGLRPESRIMMAMSGQKVPLMTALQAAMLDNLAFIAYTKTEDAQKGQNRPKSVLKQLTGAEDSKEIRTFGSAEEFERKRRMILGEGNGERN